jgi:non-heme chloroperoxidase
MLVKTEANPNGLPKEAIDQLLGGIRADRAQFFKDFSIPFYGFNRPGAKVSEGLRDSFLSQSLLAGFPNVYAFTQSADFTEDLKRFDVPTLIMHGDDDQVVPIAITSLVSSKIVKDATLKVYPGLPHGMCSTHKDLINADLLEFIEKAQTSSQTA